MTGKIAKFPILCSLERFFLHISKKIVPLSSKNLYFIPMKRLIPILLALFAILTIGVICCNRAVINTATDRMYDDVAAIPYKRFGVLLGTNPKGRSGKPNVFYIRRVEACVALYKAGKIERILVSGDNSRTTYDEPTCIKEDLIAAGVPDSVIYLDYAGFRTYDSMVRSIV